MKFFEASAEQLAWLASRDRTLGEAIEKIGPIKRRVWPDSLAALIRAIIGQQISGAAQDSIWSRFQEKAGGLSAGEIAQLPLEDLRGLGISQRKAGYIQAIAKGYADGRISHARLEKMPDDELVACLTEYPGIGKWTAEMLLIFTFQRPNALSFGDLAIRRGMIALYGHERVTREIFLKHYRDYSPCATIAGFYLWEIAGQRKSSKIGS